MKKTPNDCDLHLELTRPGGTKTESRIIAEIKSDAAFDDIRKLILDRVAELKARNFVKRNGDLLRRIKVRITGFAFYDAAHWSRNDDIAGKNHGTVHVATLWEIHPILRLELLN